MRGTARVARPTELQARRKNGFPPALATHPAELRPHGRASGISRRHLVSARRRGAQPAANQGDRRGGEERCEDAGSDGDPGQDPAGGSLLGQLRPAPFGDGGHRGPDVVLDEFEGLAELLVGFRQGVDVGDVGRLDPAGVGVERDVDVLEMRKP